MGLLLWVGWVIAAPWVTHAPRKLMSFLSLRFQTPEPGLLEPQWLVIAAPKYRGWVQAGVELAQSPQEWEME